MKNFDLGNQFRILRKINKLNLSDVKTLLYQYGFDTSISTISKWEKNVLIPSLEQIKIICYIFNISISQLLDEPNSKRATLNYSEAQFLEMIKYNTNYKKFLLLLAKENMKGSNYDEFKGYI